MQVIDDSLAEVTHERTTREQEFKNRFRGVPAAILTSAFGRAARGITFKGCTKGHLAELWADRELKGYESLQHLSLDEIEQIVRAEQEKKIVRAPAPTRAISVRQRHIPAPIVYADLANIANNYFKVLPNKRKREELARFHDLIETLIEKAL